MTADLHVIPIGDLREHLESRQCWCKPMEDFDCPRVVVHNAMDRREHTVEQGNLQ